MVKKSYSRFFWPFFSLFSVGGEMPRAFFSLRPRNRLFQATSSFSRHNQTEKSSLPPPTTTTLLTTRRERKEESRRRSSIKKTHHAPFSERTQWRIAEPRLRKTRSESTARSSSDRFTSSKKTTPPPQRQRLVSRVVAKRAPPPAPFLLHAAPAS